MKRNSEQLCPVCHEKFFLRDCRRVPLKKHRIRCPNCDATLRKGYGVKMLVWMILFAYFVGVCMENIVCWILMVISGSGVVITAARTPYVADYSLSELIKMSEDEIPGCDEKGKGKSSKLHDE